MTEGIDGETVRGTSLTSLGGPEPSRAQVQQVWYVGLSLLALEGVGEPVKTVEETVSGGGASGDDVPLAVAERLQAELLSDVSDGHGVGEILLVGQDENDGLTELILAKQLLKLQGGLIDTLAIVGVDDVDDTLSVEVVVAPQGTDLVLSSDVPAKRKRKMIGKKQVVSGTSNSEIGRASLV